MLLASSHLSDPLYPLTRQVGVKFVLILRFGVNIISTMIRPSTNYKVTTLWRPKRIRKALREKEWSGSKAPTILYPPHVNPIAKSPTIYL